MRQCLRRTRGAISILIHVSRMRDVGPRWRPKFSTSFLVSRPARVAQRAHKSACRLVWRLRQSLTERLCAYVLLCRSRFTLPRPAINGAIRAGVCRVERHTRMEALLCHARCCNRRPAASSLHWSRPPLSAWHRAPPWLRPVATRSTRAHSMSAPVVTASSPACRASRSATMSISSSPEAMARPFTCSE